MLRRLLIASISVLLLAGCAGTTPRVSEMVPLVTRSNIQHPITLEVEVVLGGEQTNLMTGSRIDAQTFHSALVIALSNSGLFLQATPGQPENYKLNAMILSQDQPLVGLAFTVSMLVRYEMVDAQSQQAVWTKDIPSNYTAKFFDSLNGAKRLNLANEGVVRNNIQNLLNELASLQFE